MNVSPSFIAYAKAVYHAPMQICKDHIYINDEGRSEILQAKKRLQPEDLALLRKETLCQA